MAQSHQKPSRRPIIKHPIVVVILVTLLGAAIRFSFIAKASIWHDEAFSVILSSRNMLSIWLSTARDVHPPLYYELLHLWLSLFGRTEFALRSLSAVAGVAVIPIGYMVAKKASGRRAGYFALVFLALAPFLVRYSQEARMYGLLGLELLLALWAVMNMVNKPKQFWAYAAFAVTIAAGLYTHYFTVLAVFSFWVYLILLQPFKQWKFGKTIWLSWRWWVANIVAGVLFLPWVPSMLVQLKRAQGLGWLQPTSIRTAFDTTWQFLTFTDGRLTTAVYWLVGLVVIAGIVWLWLDDKTKQKYTRLLVLYTALPITIGIVVSLFKPLFHERYFAFAAIGFYILLALAVDRIYRLNLWLAVVAALLICAVETVGIRNVYAQSNHQMRAEVAVLNDGFQSGDVIVSGELYTYFDGTYYNSTGQRILLYTGAAGRPNGYGESGLIYDQNVYLGSYSQIPPGSRVWLVGKTGDHSYYDQVPVSWQLQQQAQAGYSEVRLYQVK